MFIGFFVVSFQKRPRRVLVHRPKENKLFDFLTSQQNEYFVDKLSNHPRRDTNLKKTNSRTKPKDYFATC